MRFRICTYFLYLLVITYDALSASFGRRRMMSRCQIDVTMLKKMRRNFRICVFLLSLRLPISMMIWQRSLTIGWLFTRRNPFCGWLGRLYLIGVIVKTFAKFLEFTFFLFSWETIAVVGIVGDGIYILEFCQIYNFL